jgi:hypothetical protein
MMINFLKPKEKTPREGHVVLTNSESGDTMVHFWRGDAIQNGYCVKIDEDQAMKLRDALIHKFGV